MNEDKILSFVISDNPLATRYWQHTKDASGTRQYPEKTTTIAIACRLTTVELGKIATATVKLSCKQCDVVLEHKVKSRTGLINLLGDLDREYPAWEYSDTTCAQCKAKKALQDGIEQEQRRAQRAIEQSLENAKKDAMRAKKKPRVHLDYGARMLGECPTCHTGFRVLRINSKTFELFIGCSSYGVCSHTETADEDTLPEYRSIFLAELSRIWGLTNLAVPFVRTTSNPHTTF